MINAYSILQNYGSQATSYDIAWCLQHGYRNIILEDFCYYILKNKSWTCEKSKVELICTCERIIIEV